MKCPIPNCVNYPVRGSMLCSEHEGVAEVVLYILNEVYDLDVVDDYDSQDETVFPITRQVGFRRDKKENNKKGMTVGDSN